jgi:hypothetical protein
MIKRTVAMAIVSMPLLSGCAAYISDDAFLTQALQEREAAYTRLAKAITRYCTVTTDTLEARHACISEQHLLLLPIEQPRVALRSSTNAGSFATR